MSVRGSDEGRRGGGRGPDQESDREAGGDAPVRGRILARVREALAGREAEEHPGAFPGAALDASNAAVGDPVERFAEAFLAAGGEVVRFGDSGEAARWLAGLDAGGDGVAVAPDVPEALRPPGTSVPPREAALGVSMARAAGADTGSLVLAGDAGRAVQLLPPVHVVWVPVPVVTASLEEALRAGAGERIPLTLRALALHSGPSKSADIGQIVVTGVHGPGRVVAALLDVEALPDGEPGPGDAASETEHGAGP